MRMLTASLPERSSDYIPTLDGWRALSITAVLCSHAYPWHISAENDGLSRLVGAFLLRVGSLGVLVFFAISGYLICTRLLLDEGRHGVISLGSFYLRRAFRILPASLCYLIVIAFLGIVGLYPAVANEQFRWYDWLSALFFYCNYWPRQMLGINHFWSLAVEEHFYLIWPSLLAIGGTRIAARCALATVVICPLWRFLVLNSLSSGEYAAALERTDMRLDSFFMPCLLAILLQDNRWQERLSWLAHPICRSAMLLCLGMAFFVPAAHPTMGALQRLLIPHLLTGFVLSTTLSPSDWLGQLLESRLLRFVGRLSYGIYLWQQLILYCHPSYASFSVSNVVVIVLFRLAVLLLVAIASYRWIEVPMIRFGRKLASRLAEPQGSHGIARATPDM